jgi:Holliday junction resolvase RusA-like endonuclease
MNFRPVVVVHVYGLPKPAGSKRVFMVGTGDKRRPVVTDAAGQPGRDWRASIQDAIARRHPGAPFTGPLAVTFTFTVPRPQGHVGRHGTLRPSAPAYPTTRPDVTKLIRAVEDAATGLLWRDDAQLVVQSATKHFGERPGVVIHCRCLEAQERRDDGPEAARRVGG